MKSEGEEKQEPVTPMSQGSGEKEPSKRPTDEEQLKEEEEAVVVVDVTEPPETPPSRGSEEKRTPPSPVVVVASPRALAVLPEIGIDWGQLASRSREAREEAIFGEHAKKPKEAEDVTTPQGLDFWSTLAERARMARESAILGSVQEPPKPEEPKKKSEEPPEPQKSEEPKKPEEPTSCQVVVSDSKTAEPEQPVPAASETDQAREIVKTRERCASAFDGLPSGGSISDGTASPITLSEGQPEISLSPVPMLPEPNPAKDPKVPTLVLPPIQAVTPDRASPKTEETLSPVSAGQELAEPLTASPRRRKRHHHHHRRHSTHGKSHVVTSPAFVLAVGPPADGTTPTTPISAKVPPLLGPLSLNLDQPAPPATGAADEGPKKPPRGILLRSSTVMPRDRAATAWEMSTSLSVATGHLTESAPVKRDRGTLQWKKSATQLDPVLAEGAAAAADVKESIGEIATIVPEVARPSRMISMLMKNAPQSSDAGASKETLDALAAELLQERGRPKPAVSPSRAKSTGTLSRQITKAVAAPRKKLAGAKIFVIELEELLSEAGRILYIPDFVARCIDRLINFAKSVHGASAITPPTVPSTTTPEVAADGRSPPPKTPSPPKLAEDPIAVFTLESAEFPKRLEQAMSDLDLGKCGLDAIADIRDVVFLFREFFRCLPTALIPFQLYAQFVACAEGSDDELYTSNAMLPGIWSMKDANRATLQHVLSTLRKFFVVPSQDQAVACQILGAALGSAFLRPPARDEQAKKDCAAATAAMFRFYDALFTDGVELGYTLNPLGESIVKQASTRMLIEKLTDEHYQLDEKFAMTFLLTYQYFLTHRELYLLIMDCCKRCVTVQGITAWRERKKERLVRLVSRWARLRGMELAMEAPSVAIALSAEFPRGLVTETTTVQSWFQECKRSAPRPFVFPEAGQESLSRVLWSCDPKTLAEQITFFHHELFAAIPISELIKKKKLAPGVEVARKKDQEKDAAPFANAFVTAFNRLTGWLVSELVLADGPTGCLMLDKSIRLAGECLRLQNFNGAMSLSAALQHTAVGRLAEAWSRLPKKRMATFKELEQIFNLNFSNYRPLIATSSPPAIPSLIVIQHDLLGLEENSDTWASKRTANPLVNFEKMRKIGDILMTVKRYQLTGYDIKPDPPVQLALRNLRVLEEQSFYRRTKRAQTVST